MNESFAFQEEPREELLNGEIIPMSPRPTVNHNWIAGRIFVAFSNYLKGKKCIPFSDGTDVYLTDKDRVIPDAMIVCSRDIIQNDGIHSAPDLVVEVLSPSSIKRDRGYKKELYEKAGVREYWIVEPALRSIEVYLLMDGKYRLDDVYAFPENIAANKIPDFHKDAVPVSLYKDFSIPLEDIFSNLF